VERNAKIQKNPRIQEKNPRTQEKSRENRRDKSKNTGDKSKNTEDKSKNTEDKSKHRRPIQEHGGQTWAGARESKYTSETAHRPYFGTSHGASNQHQSSPIWPVTIEGGI
jgi:hypothetical protein